MRRVSCLAVVAGLALAVPLHEAVAEPDAVHDLRATEAAELEPAAESAAQERQDAPLWQPDPGLEQSWLQYEYAAITTTSDGSVNGSHSGRQALIETVVGRTEQGLRLHYDLPRDEDGNANSGFWYFPVDVIKRPEGSLHLADPVAVTASIENWLAQRKVPRELCGVWTHGGGFPFKYDCDPQSVIEQIEPFDLRLPGIAAGEPFDHPLGLEPGIFQPPPDDPTALIASFAIDPAKARAQEVEQRLILAQMLGNEVSRERAIADASKVGFEGTITLRFDFDGSGAVLRRTAETHVTVTRPGEESETTLSTNVVTRHSQEPDHRLPSALRDKYLAQDERFAPQSEEIQE